MDYLIRISTLGAVACRVFFTFVLGVVPGALPAQETAAPARTPDVHFVPTAVEVVKAMLDAAKVNKQDLVYDLGCGDGRIVITAVKRYGAQGGVCVDIDPARIKESRRNADTAGVADKIEFMNADLFQTDLSKATVVTLYLLPMLNVRLRPKLFRELPAGTRIVSNAFDMGDWKADSTMNVKNEGGFTSYAYLWHIPADVSGAWKVTAPGPGGGFTLRLEQTYQQLKGTAESGGKPVTLEEPKVKGDSVSFTLRDGPAARRFSGVVQQEKMSGTVTGGRATGGQAGAWSASRTQRGARPELKDSTDSGTQ